MAKRIHNPDPREREHGHLEEKCNDTGLASPPPRPNPVHAHAKTPNILMTLPPEIRNRIYEYALARPRETISISHVSEPALLIAGSSEIRKDAAPIYYFNNRIQMGLRLRQDKMSWIFKSLRAITNLCGNKPFSGFRLMFLGPFQHNMSGLLPILELIRDTGLVLGTKGKTIGGSLFHWEMLEEPEDAVAMGMQAHEAGWSRRELAETFKLGCRNREERLEKRLEENMKCDSS